MAFVNKYIPEPDFKKYGIEAIDNQFIVGGTHSQGWTIDRERDMYLRCVTNGREEFVSESTWTFYWHGELLIVRLKIMNTRGGPGERGWTHYRLRGNFIPARLYDQRAEILNDLKEALTAYKDGGVYSKAPTFDPIYLDEEK